MGGGSSKGSKGSKRPSSAPSPRPAAAEPELQDQHVPPAFNPAASTLVLELELEPEPEAQLQTAVVAQPQLERRMSWVLRAELDVSAAPTVAELPPVPTPCRFEYSFALERSVFREVQEAGRGGSAVVWSWDAGGNRDAAAAAAWRAYSKAESAQLEAAWEVTGKKTRHLRHSNVKRPFYQDGLGTNIGNAQKETHFLIGSKGEEKLPSGYTINFNAMQQFKGASRSHRGVLRSIRATTVQARQAEGHESISMYAEPAKTHAAPTEHVRNHAVLWVTGRQAADVAADGEEWLEVRWHKSRDHCVTGFVKSRNVIVGSPHVASAPTPAHASPRSSRRSTRGSRGGGSIN